MGGLPRRATLIDQEKSGNAGVLILDSGNLATERPLSERSLDPIGTKAELIIRAMDYMGYGAVAVGEMDLYLGRDRLEKLAGMTRIKFLSANVKDGQGKNLFDPYRIFRVKGIRVGVIGLTAPPSNISMFSRRMPGAVVLDPFQSAREEIDTVRPQCDLLVVLSNIGYARDVQLAREVPGIDVVISGGSKRFLKRPVKEGNTLLTSGYYEGRAVGKLVIHLTGKIKGWVSRDELAKLDGQIKATKAKTGTPAGKRYYEGLLQRKKVVGELTLYEPDMVNLDPSLADDPKVVAMISDYRKELAQQKKISPPGEGEGGSGEIYTGSEACRQCHEARYRFWLTTPHAGAFKALAPKNAGSDPDCLPCHVTGYMRRTGYWPRAPNERLRGVQCEACHGVGSHHVSSPELYSLVPDPLAPRCLDCHTPEQDDNFDYIRDKKLVCSEHL